MVIAFVLDENGIYEIWVIDLVGNNSAGGFFIMFNVIDIQVSVWLLGVLFFVLVLIETFLMFAWTFV